MKRDNIEEDFPFLSGLTVGEQEYVGIIQNQDNQVTSFYDFDMINTPEEKETFLELGDIWWWESSRMLPINIFLQHDFVQFRYCLKTFINKDIEVMFGPVTSLQNILQKRIKRRQIQLVQKVED